MSRRDMDGNETVENEYSGFALSGTLRFWLLLVFEVPSLFCSLLLLGYLLNDRLLRQSLHNHVIIALLVVGLFAQLIDVPFYLNFVRINYISPASSVTCVLWWFAATGISNMTNLLMAWASIERHILVFHDRWLINRRRRFFFHYLPLLTVLVYSFTYYAVILLVYRCENLRAFDQDWCLYPCFYNDVYLAMYDTVVNAIIPTPTIVFLCCLLLIRFIQRKRRHRHRFQWRKHRMMVIQLVSISAMFLLFDLPMTSLLLAHLLGLPSTATSQFEYITYFLHHYVSLLMPFVCLLSLPEIRNKIKRRLVLGHVSGTVRPTTIT